MLVGLDKVWFIHIQKIIVLKWITKEASSFLITRDYQKISLDQLSVHVPGIQYEDYFSLRRSVI